ncbi:MAG: OmpH family outer membrane protein [Paludibacter sp.]|jgi:outer membrane protein|nr:OmpH family outer membrane protein [Paludibacter sp.]HOS45561.1 OmpH family outer membrane protein [Paludibacter sp.]HPM09391.1 OmpH family outer membrane protein [Paludibacter sp.]
MIKRIALIVLLALPFSLMAQEKFAYVNVQEIFQVMPELSDVEKTIADLNEEYKLELEKMYEEYYAKAKEFQDNLATMAETIKTRRQSEIVDLENRISTFQQTASQELQQKQMELVSVLRDKIIKATAEVGEENNYTYIFDLSTQSIAYHSPKAVDVTPLVKKKLGIK